MNAAVKDDEAGATSPDGPGKQLRLVREQQGLDLERVAALLHLSADKLAALEADNYQLLPGAVFVQGYLRNYARLVDVPVEPLLSAFHKLNHGKERPPELYISQVRHEVRSSHVLIRLMTWVIVISLIALVVIWWRGYLQWPLTTVPTEDEVPALATGEADSQSGQPAVVATPSAGETLTELDSSGEAALMLPAQPAVAPEEPDSAPPPEAEAPGDGTLLPLPQVEATDDGMLLPLPAAPAQEETVQAEPLLLESSVEAEPQAPAETVLTASARVVIEFSDTSWTEIRDASGSFKILGEISAGSRRVLGGTPPYKLVLGNAKAVSISVDGKPFDLTPYIRGKVARLTLNPDQ